MTESAAYRQAVDAAFAAQLDELIATMNGAQAAGHNPLKVVEMFTRGADLAGVRRQLALVVPGYSNNFAAAPKPDGWDQAFGRLAGRNE